MPRAVYLRFKCFAYQSMFICSTHLFTVHTTCPFLWINVYPSIYYSINLSIFFPWRVAISLFNRELSRHWIALELEWIGVSIITLTKTPDIEVHPLCTLWQMEQLVIRLFSFSPVNREFRLSCRGIGVHPPLRLSSQEIHFRATSLYDSSTVSLHVHNDHVSNNVFSFPVPRLIDITLFTYNHYIILPT